LPPLHRLLQRQLRAHFGPDGPPDELKGFLQVVHEAYLRFDADRALLERSLELSSEELMIANAEMRGVLQAFPDLFFTLDPEGRVLSCRARSDSDLFGGQQPRDLVGRLIHEVASPAARVRFRDGIERMRAGAPFVRVEYSQPGDVGDEHFEARLVGLQDGQVLCIIRDITDLRRAEEAARRSEEHYRLLFEANPQPMWVFDRETYAFLAVNEAAVQHYGWSREEFLAMTAKDIRPPEDVPALLTLVEHTFAPTRPGVFRHLMKDGTVIEVETVGNPMSFNGRPAIMVLVNDVTEHRRLEEQVRQVQRMEAVGRLAGGVAHDFNNLLTVISGYTEMLVKSLHDRAADKRRAEEIQRAAARAAELTRQLLAFGRKQVMEPRVLDLDQVVRGMLPMLSRLMGEHVEMRVERAPALGRVKADPGQIEQVVMNLAINARDAMPGGGSLVVELADVDLAGTAAGPDAPLRSGPHVMLAVRDTGCGMDAATQARIFEPFFTTKELGKGTGLGLATVYGIIQQSGGTIRVESEPGRGSVFRVYLPRVDEAAEAAETAAAAGAAGSGHETVLVVEDEPVVRALVRDVLAAHGYHVLVAGNAHEALRAEQACLEPIALLVTDVVMPGPSGRELAQEFSRRRPRARVLFVSGYANDAFVNRGLLQPGTWFLQKPFSPEVLAARVREILDAEAPAQAA